MNPSPNIPSRVPASRAYFRLGPTAVRILSALALGSLIGWFALKLVLPLEAPWAQLTVGLLALCGMCCCVAVFLTTYSHVANAPAEQIDERELVQRNAAYVWSYQAVGVVVLAALLLLDRATAWTGHTVDTATYVNLLTVIFFGQLVLPAAVLAWRDTSADD